MEMFHVFRGEVRDGYGAVNPGSFLHPLGGL